MRSRILLGLLLLTTSCGDLGPTPSEKVLASQKKEEGEAPYTDPYADGKKLAEEKGRLKPLCDEAQTKLASLDLKGVKLTKEEQAAVAAGTAAMTTACQSAEAELQVLLPAFSDAAKKLLNLASEHRGKSLKGIDLYRGKVDPAKEKEEKIFTTSANTFEQAGDLAIDYMQAYLMYAPLAQRKQAAPAIFELQDRLPPDYAEQMQGKRLGKAMTAEGDPELRKLLRSEVYGVLPE
jgi:hypothetical protein